ncbi:MAG: hypothetical protein R3C05_23985 [Pirellulaceae bacterium]
MASFCAAVYLVFVRRRLPTIVAYLPMAAAPIVVGVLQSSFSFIREIGVSLRTGVEDINLVLLLALCWVPTVLGILASIPGYLTIAIGLLISTLKVPQAADAEDAGMAKSEAKPRRVARTSRRQSVDAESGRVRVDEVSYLSMKGPEDIDY